MKKRLLSILLVLCLLMTSGMTVFATEPEENTSEEVQTDAAVQASYDAYCKMVTALENKDLDVLRTAATEFEAANEKLTEEQQEELEELAGEEFWNVIITSNVITLTAKLYDAFLADKNASTA